MSVEKIFEKVELVLKSIKGTIDVKILLNDHRSNILELEEAFEKETLTQSRRFYNEGIREVLNRQVVIVLLHNKDFRHPPEPLVKWKMGGVDIGEEVWKAEVLDELKNRKDALLVGNTFVIYKNRLKSSPLVDFVILFPALSFPELEGLYEIKDVVSASPSVPTDIYIKNVMGWDSKLGVILIGFNLTESIYYFL
ncbi:MAG: hypothetical protein QXL52_00820 [Nitrososphaerales archaeon]